MDQTDVGLRAVLKALNDIVAPALDPADFLAQEQLRLSVDYIAFLRRRLDLLHGRERFDLAHQVALAEVLLAALPADRPEAGAMARRLEPARAALADPGTLTGALRDLALELGHVVAAGVRLAEESPPSVAAAIRRGVLSETERRIAFERIWYAPIGFEPIPLDEDQLIRLLQ